VYILNDKMSLLLCEALFVDLGFIATDSGNSRASIHARVEHSSSFKTQPSCIAHNCSLWNVVCRDVDRLLLSEYTIGHVMEPQTLDSAADTVTIQTVYDE
jgi:hypothetical protein